MTSLGEKLRAARESKGLTPSQVAEATRIKVQTIQQLENNDFSRIAAPIYGKGFIRMYAEFVGLDPAPLVDEYASRVAASEAAIAAAARVSMTAQAGPDRTSRVGIEEGPPWLGALRQTVGSLGRRLRRVSLSEISWIRYTGRPLEAFRSVLESPTVKYVGAAVACFIVLVLVVTGISRCNAGRHAALPADAYLARDPLKLTHEPPPPYLRTPRSK